MDKIVALIFSAAISAAAVGADWISAPRGVLEQQDIEQILQKHPLAAGENARVVPLQKNARSAQQLVQIRHRELLHRHADSDITVFILRGQGDMRIGKDTRPVKSGDIIHIERNAVHAYINRGPEPAAALVVYSPAPGPKDRILVEEKK